jgi:hypothetical protein
MKIEQDIRPLLDFSEYEAMQENIEVLQDIHISLAQLNEGKGIDHRQAKEALLHHLQALKEIPLDIMIPARITLSTQDMQKLVNILTNPPEPNTALLDLMAN